MQQLGVVLSPYGKIPGGWYAEIAQARGGKGQYLLPYDPYYNQRGEVGFYHDTQLGDIPTDAELAKTYVCYTPVDSGWINAKQGFITGPWRFGWDPAGAFGPPTSLSGYRGFGLGQTAPMPQQTAVDVVAVMNLQNKRLFHLAIISTAAVSISAMFTLWTRWKRLKLELHKRKKR